MAFSNPPLNIPNYMFEYRISAFQKTADPVQNAAEAQAIHCRLSWGSQVKSQNLHVNHVIPTIPAEQQKHPVIFH